MGWDLFGTKKAAKTQAAIAGQAAAETQAREAKREADVGAGKTAIDQAFAQYNPDFFSNYKSAYLNNYNPQVDRQYTMAQDKLKAQLAGQGVLESGVGNNAFADLANTYATAKSGIAGQANDAANQLQSKIDNSKTSLYSANAAAADPQSAAAQATALSTSLAQPTTYSPLADLFSSALNSYGAYRSASNGNTGGGGGAIDPNANGPGGGYYRPSSTYGGSSVSTVG